MTTSSLRLTVLMSVYNGEKYLREAVDSILSQTFRDFEFLIINDGSSDGTAQILESYDDPRMRIVYNEENIGLTRSLNKGLKLARGEYIARMDADDISLPERLEKQVEFLDAHPEVGVLGTWVEVIDGEGTVGQVWRSPQVPTSPALLNWTLMFHNCLPHPSAMMRLRVIEGMGGYDPEIRYAQDYDLWARASLITDLTNLSQVLLRRRVAAEAVTGRHFQAQEQVAVRVMHALISGLFAENVPVETVQSLRQLFRRESPTGVQQIRSTASLIERLCSAYLRTRAVSPAEKKEITRQAAAELVALAGSARCFSRRHSLVIFTKAAVLDRRLLFTLPQRVIPPALRRPLARALRR